MIAVDTNILVYAHREDSAFHAAALKALLGLVEQGAAWAIPWPCVHEFLAVVTHPRIYQPPTPQEVAAAAIAVWTDSPGCRLLAEGPGYLEILAKLVRSAKVSGPMIHDARIAALCEHHGVRELWTADRDFSRYGRLRVRNPLV